MHRTRERWKKKRTQGRGKGRNRKEKKGGEKEGEKEEGGKREESTKLHVPSGHKGVVDKANSASSPTQHLHPRRVRYG